MDGDKFMLYHYLFVFFFCPSKLLLLGFLQRNGIYVRGQNQDLKNRHLVKPLAYQQMIGGLSTNDRWREKDMNVVNLYACFTDTR